MTATLAQLVRIKSRLAEEVEAYLKKSYDQAGILPAYLPAHLRSASAENPFDHVRQEIQVVNLLEQEKWRSEHENRMREQARAAGYDDPKTAYAPWRARVELEHGQEDLEQEDGFPRDAVKTPMPQPFIWDSDASEKHPRCVILGDPGFGKTWLLCYECRQRCQSEFQALNDRTVALDDIRLPIFLRLSGLAKHLNAECAFSTAVCAGIRVTLDPDKKFSDGFYQWVASKIDAGKAFLLFDAFDEVPVDAQQMLGFRLQSHLQEANSDLRLLLSSRIVGYPGSPFPTGTGEEFELQAFQPEQIESFATVCFRDSSAETAKQFMSLLNNQPQVSGLARIPLMLALMCRIYINLKPGQSFPARRTDLYERCFQGLLFEWNIAKGKIIGGDYIKALMDFLKPVAYELFSKGYERFTETDLRNVIDTRLRMQGDKYSLGRTPIDAARIHIEEAKRTGRNLDHDEILALLDSSVAQGKKTEIDRLLDELKEDGILVITSTGDVPELLFLHRTFQEYLAAAHLAKQIENECDRPPENHTASAFPATESVDLSALLDKKCWNPAWQHIIILAAGCLTDPLPLLTYLANEETDSPFLHKHLLAAQCLAEVKEPPREIVGLLTERLFEMWWQCLDRGFDLYIPEARSIWRLLGQLNGEWRGKTLHRYLVEHLNSGCKKRNESAKRIISLIGVPAATRELVLTLQGSILRNLSSYNYRNDLPEKACPRIRVVGRLFIDCLPSTEKIETSIADELCRLFTLDQKFFNGLLDGHLSTNTAIIHRLEQWAENVSDNVIDICLRHLQAKGDFDEWAKNVGGICTLRKGRVSPEAISYILTELDSDNPRLAYKILGQLGPAVKDEAVAEAILKHLTPPKTGLTTTCLDLGRWCLRREQLIDWLGKHCPMAAIPEVLEKFISIIDLDDSDSFCIWYVKKAIKTMTQCEEARYLMAPLLVYQISNASPKRKAALHLIGAFETIDDLDIVRTVLNIAQRNDDTAETAIRTLRELLHRAPLGPEMETLLLSLLENPNRAIQFAAFSAVQHHGKKIESVLIVDALCRKLQNKDDVHEFGQSLYCLQRLGPIAAVSNVFATLIKIVADENIDNEIYYEFGLYYVAHDCTQIGMANLPDSLSMLLDAFQYVPRSKNIDGYFDFRGKFRGHIDSPNYLSYDYSFLSVAVITNLLHTDSRVRRLAVRLLADSNWWISDYDKLVSYFKDPPKSFPSESEIRSAIMTLVSESDEAIAVKLVCKLSDYIDATDAVPILLKALQSKNIGTLFFVLRSCWDLSCIRGEVLRQILRRLYVWPNKVKVMALRTLLHVEPHTIPHIINSVVNWILWMERKNRKKEVRSRYYADGPFDDDLRILLLSGYDTNYYEPVDQACYILGALAARIRFEQGSNLHALQSTIVNLLKSRIPEQSAIMGLVELGSKDPIVLNALLRELSIGRGWAAENLVSIVSYEQDLELITQEIINLINGADKRDVRVAIELLGKVGEITETSAQANAFIDKIERDNSWGLEKRNKKEFRKNIYEALMKFRDALSTTEIVQILHHRYEQSSADQRPANLVLLSRLLPKNYDSPVLNDLFIDCLKIEENPEIKASVLRGLSRMHPGLVIPEIVPILCRMLNDDDVEVRVVAAETIPELYASMSDVPAKLFDALIAQLTVPNVQVFDAALQALNRLQLGVATPVVILALLSHLNGVYFSDDDEFVVSDLAAKLLMKLLPRARNVEEVLDVINCWLLADGASTRWFRAAWQVAPNKATMSARATLQLLNLRFQMWEDYRRDKPRVIADMTSYLRWNTRLAVDSGMIVFHPGGSSKKGAVRQLTVS